MKPLITLYNKYQKSSEEKWPICRIYKINSAEDLYEVRFDWWFQDEGKIPQDLQVHQTAGRATMNKEQLKRFADEILLAEQEMVNLPGEAIRLELDFEENTSQHFLDFRVHDDAEFLYFIFGFYTKYLVNKDVSDISKHYDLQWPVVQKYRVCLRADVLNFAHEIYRLLEAEPVSLIDSTGHDFQKPLVMLGSETNTLFRVYHYRPSKGYFEIFANLERLTDNFKKSDDLNIIHYLICNKAQLKNFADELLAAANILRSHAVNEVQLKLQFVENSVNYKFSLSLSDFGGFQFSINHCYCYKKYQVHHQKIDCQCYNNEHLKYISISGPVTYEEIERVAEQIYTLVSN
jgi:hypothetical protein